MRRTLLALCSLSLFLVPADLLAARKDPLTTFLFALKIEVAGIGEATAFFKSVQGLGSESEVVDYHDGGTPGFTRKLVGPVKWPSIVLKQGFTGDKTLHLWRQQFERGQSDPSRKSATILLLDKSNAEVARWTLMNAWPSKLTIEVDEETGELLEVVEIAAEFVTRQ